MQDSDLPSTKFPTVWAASAGGGFIRTPPVPSQQGISPGAASFTDGFPPLNFSPVASGGIPPFGADANGLLNLVTAWGRWYQAGGAVPYDSTFQTAVGGYPKGAIVASGVIAGLRWQSTADNNTSNPDTGGANWVPIRVRITGTLTISIATTGTDAFGNGIPGAATPFATLTYAHQFVRTYYDCGNQNVIFSCADGTYAGQIIIGSLLNCAGQTIQGHVGNPLACKLNGTGVAGLIVNNIAEYSVGIVGINFASSAGGGAFAGTGLVVGEATVGLTGQCSFDVCATAHMSAGAPGSTLTTNGNAYSIVGAAPVHVLAYETAMVLLNGSTVTLAAGFAFSSAFASASDMGLIKAGGCTFSGPAATGKRYSADGLSLINTGGGGATFFPGNSSGTTTNGGVYI